MKYAVINKLSGDVLSFWYDSREYAERAAERYRKRYGKGLVVDIVERVAE